tara:strand:- start:21389 stop:21850 length:462 start_codon:yes stop_codon:yes gene_type:complete
MNLNRSETFESVRNKIAEVNHTDVEDLMSKIRRHELVRVRCMAYNMLYYKYGANLSEIARLFNRHHATIIHGLETHKSLIDTDEGYVSDYGHTENVLQVEIETSTRNRAISILESLESLTTIGRKIKFVEKLLESFDNNSINCDNESEHRVEN